ncbi:RNA methyltransferase [Porphyromonas somerae]|uniref:RNA methyltransferase n=1 Tax=Porphyromonas somerae TaxID=322095 RepID=UPI000360EC18|nr:RNA methyltransferase [Porphyromonas somerae]
MRKLRIEEMGRISPQEYAKAGKRPIVVVLDNIRSMHNVGAIFRTADALRLEGLYLCGITGQPPHSEIHKSALGAEEVVDWWHFDRTQEAIKLLRDKGYTIWSLEQAEGSVKLPKLKEHLGKSQPIAIVLGNEVDGVDQEVIDLSDGVVEIEQYGTKHSMNVSVAGGIVMWYLSELREIE